MTENLTTAVLPQVRITESLNSTQLSEGGVNDVLSIALTAAPIAPVTISVAVDPNQIAAIAPLEFTAANWNQPQTITLVALADQVLESNATSSIAFTASSADPTYSSLPIRSVTAAIADGGIPGFSSYRTVEETFADLSGLAAANPNIASWIDIGDTYDKITPGGAPGYDIHSLVLTNSNSNPVGGKPILYMQGALHAREYTTAELVTRFAEQLVSGYGRDADITWLLDYHQIHIVPIANPDGRKFAEQGYSWRKNTNPTSTNPPVYPNPAPFPRYGVDLNRNYDFEWGNARLKDGTPAPFASSGNPAANTYRGESAFSDPESQALSAYLRSLFSYGTGPKRIAGDPTAPVYKPEYADIPDDTPGIYIDVHSAGNWVLYPWGWYEGLVAPNNDQLRSLGRKYGFFTGTVDAPFDVIRAEQLYPADGATDDWVFGNFGVASYTLELGNTFFEPSANFESTIAPENLPALLYMAKAARRPYQTPLGPDSIAVSVDFQQIVAGVPVTLSAVADDTRYDYQRRSPDDDIEDRPFDPISDAPEPIEPIAAARYSINQPSWIPGVQTFALTPTDGTLDSAVESFQAAIDTTNFAPGRYTIFVESQDAAGNWGVPTAVFLEVAAAEANVAIGSDAADTLFGTVGADFLYGKGGDDQLFGSEGVNLLDGGAGDDVLYGGSSADTLLGGAGSDRIFAAEGNNTIDAGEGNNTVYAGSGDDVITAGSGDDVIYAAEGNNSIDAGTGENVIYSGSGRDRFFLRVGSGSTQIVNFNPAHDRFVIQPGFSVSQFAVSQASPGGLTQIQFASTGDLVATLNGVNAADITRSTFVPA